MPILQWQWPGQALHPDYNGLRTIPATSTHSGKAHGEEDRRNTSSQYQNDRKNQKISSGNRRAKGIFGILCACMGAVRHARTDTWKVGDVITRFANTGIFLQQLRNILQISVE